MNVTQFKLEAQKHFREMSKQFEKNPNSTNWLQLYAAMLIHQQAVQIRNWRVAEYETLFTNPELKNFLDYAMLVVDKETGQTLHVHMRKAAQL